MLTKKDIERFTKHIQKTSPERASGCWIWTAQRGLDGYGRFKMQKQNLLAHRVSYMINRGDIPKGFEICHTCDNPACVNPGHLFLGTHQDNCRDRRLKGRDLLFSGERNGKHKLTASQVLKIRELELPPKEIAQRFKISITQVKRLRNYEQWKHLAIQQKLFELKPEFLRVLQSGRLAV